MITEKIKQLMQQIKELDPDYEFLTEEDIEEDIEGTTLESHLNR